MNHPFKVNDKVVCVNNKNSIVVPMPIFEGVVYVVEEVIFAHDYRPLVSLVGIAPVCLHGREAYPLSSRFRKLDELKDENRLKRESEACV